MKKILIVDDQESWCHFHKNAVQKVLEDSNIETANSAQNGVVKIMENLKTPYDFVLTDMQMETDFLPKMAGEWFIEQIQTLPSYFKTKIIIISASPQIKYIAEKYNVDYIRKSSATVSLEPYEELLNNFY